MHIITSLLGEVFKKNPVFGREVPYTGESLLGEGCYSYTRGGGNISIMNDLKIKYASEKVRYLQLT